MRWIILTITYSFIIGILVFGVDFLVKSENLKLSGYLIEHSSQLVHSLLIIFIFLGIIFKQKALVEEHKQMFHTFFDSNLDGMIHLNQSGEVIDINDATIEITGYKADEIIEKHYCLLIVPAEKKKVANYVGMAFTGEPQTFNAAYVHKNGERKEIGVTLTPAMINQKVIGVIGLFKDITKEKALQRKLKEVNKKLNILANVDGLTKIPNRYQFGQTLKSEWYRNMRNSSKISLLMIDIDQFKLYNDYYGHIQGDECLIKIAQTIANSIQRAGEHASRYGGEEFAVILPNTDEEGALIVAKKIQKAIKELEIPHKKSEVDPHLTVSIGIATIMPNQKMKSEELIKQADHSLYKAKEAGRNRIML